MIFRLWPILALMLLATCSGGGGAPGVGQVCAAGIVGERIEPIQGKLRGCSVANPVRVHEVAGIRLSRPAVMDCSTAKDLKAWVQRGLKPAFADAGARVQTMVVYDDYNCRPRNNRPGAKLSLHARGRAIDIGEFILADGQRVTVLKDWGRGQWGPVLRRLHSAACGPFGTVLGPNYNGAHANHLHFDNDGYGRGGRFCR